MKPPEFNPTWPDEVRAVYKHDLQEIWDSTIAKHIWNQYHNQLDIYLRLAGESDLLDILDIGCAQGTLALLLAEQGHRVWAVDIRQHFLDYAVSRYEHGAVQFVCGNALEMDIDQRFDLIFANQIVEHLIHPLEFTQRLVGWLKPGGRLVVTTPNGDYIKNDLPSFSDLREPAKYEDLQFTADGDGHFFAYRAAELIQVFEGSGLKRLNVRYFETPFISGHMKMRYLHTIVPVSILGLCDSLALCLPMGAKRLAHQLMIIGALPA
jgi:2-polyprenyl-3-methyl-5-hydroxy-6-metoxy-1,4-benzoquinol methylase